MVVMKKGQCTELRNALRRIGIGLIVLFAMAYQAPAVLKAADDVPIFYHYTDESGLPSSYVKGITQDQYGFIWLATRVDVCRFDGSQYKEFPAYDENGELTELLCNQIFTCPDSLLVCRTNQGKYYYFDADLECFKAYELLNDIGQTQSVGPAIGGYWICRDNNIYFLDSKTRLLSDLRKMDGFNKIPNNISFLRLLVKGDHLVVLSDDQLLFWLDLKNKSFRSFEMPAIFGGLPITDFYLDHLNYLWISEESRGLCRMNLNTGKYTYFASDHQDNTYIPHNMVHCFSEDKQNRLWIGSEAGLFLWSNTSESFSFHQFEPANPGGLNADPIYSSYCDKKGNIWLGTYFSGINFWSSEKSFFKTWNSVMGNYHLGGNVVSCLREDTEGNLWIAFEDMGLNKYNVRTGELVKYTSNADHKSLTYNNLHDLLFVSDNELWIASYTGGINILNPKTGTFTYLNQRNNSELPSNNIYALYRNENLIYIATSQGIALYDINTRKISRFRANQIGDIEFQSISRSYDRIWFSSIKSVYYLDLKTDSLIRFDKTPQMSNINFVKVDSKGRIWIGDCYKGLCYFDEKSGKVVYFNKEDNFPASWIFSLEEGKNGWLWVSTDKGLINFNPETKSFVLYDSNSGISFNQFNFRASYTDKHGNIYFGGNSGMISFNENDNLNVSKNKPIIFTGLQLFNKPVQPGDDSPLKKSLNKLKELQLRYDQNVFTLEYTALNFSTHGRCQYAYYLENFEKSWSYVGNRNFATYTNLSPGTYYFHIKGSENNIMNETEEQVFKIVIKPPYYLTTWAFMVYFILICLISIILYMIGKRLEKSKALVAIERLEKEHVEEINKVKLEFFTNISHELKTPLTLILGPLSKIMGEEKLSPVSKKRLSGIEKNAHRLFQLINQLLEFRKIENGKEPLQVCQSDIRLLAREIKESFESMSESKGIDFRVNSPSEETLIWFDGNKVDKILFNLLSNAFKFTNDNGIVELTIDVVKREERSRKSSQDLVISVADSGKGIKPEMLDKVFDRFFQIEDGNSKHKGSGIGLAYVKSLVNLHRGQIKVESDGAHGTKFTVVIPASQVDYSTGEIVNSDTVRIGHEENMDMDADYDLNIKMIDSNGTSRLPIVLIVEDNQELLEFMKESLEENYQIYTANNGVEALEKLRHFAPELIISDVMMPQMDGFEFTRKIKSTINTSHIPVILLTAKSGIDNKYKGLKTGADYYIEKPFYPDILEQNIENILKTRRSLIERFKKDAFVPMSEIAQSESDKVFVEKLTAIVLSNISDPDMDVTYLIQKMAVSRSLLHMKLKGLADSSTTEFIRSIRLKEAVKLISSGKCNISEAAYETGFSSPAYFTRRFKEHYGKSPRDYFNM